MIIMIVALVLAILAPILARLLYFAISRKREYLADASAVRLTRYPEGLAAALEKISNSDLDLQKANKITAPMYIVNPLKKKGMKLSDLSSTHPPISERIRILRNLQQGANFKNYQQAFEMVKGKKSDIIPPSDLIDPAIIRTGRVDNLIYFPPTDFKARVAMFEIHLKARPLELGINFEKLAYATENFVSSDIEFLVNESAREALKNRSKISQQILDDIIANAKPSVSARELKKYEEIKRKFEDGDDDGRNPIGFRRD